MQSVKKSLFKADWETNVTMWKSREIEKTYKKKERKVEGSILICLVAVEKKWKMCSDTLLIHAALLTAAAKQKQSMDVLRGC